MTTLDLEAIKQRAEAASYGPAEDKEEVCRYDIPALIARVEELEAEHTKALDLWQDSTRDEHILRALLRRALPCVEEWAEIRAEVVANAEDDTAVAQILTLLLKDKAQENQQLAADIREALGEE